MSFESSLIVPVELELLLAALIKCSGTIFQPMIAFNNKNVIVRARDDSARMSDTIDHSIEVLLCSL